MTGNNLSLLFSFIYTVVYNYATISTVRKQGSIAILHYCRMASEDFFSQLLLCQFCYVRWQGIGKNKSSSDSHIFHIPLTLFHLNYETSIPLKTFPAACLPVHTMVQIRNIKYILVKRKKEKANMHTQMQLYLPR